MQKVVLYISVLAVGAAIVGSFLFVGSPVYNHKLLADKDVFAELANIHCSQTHYYHAHGNVTPRLDTRTDSVPVNDCTNTCYVSSNWMAETPDLATRYTYTPKKAGYTICAEMKANWAEYQKRLSAHERTEMAWAENYGTGKACFTRTIPPCKKRKTT